MKNKISIYTKTGDKGETTRFGGEKLSKAESLFECLGDLDELNCVIGLCKEHATVDELKNDLKKIQNQLFDIGAYIASPKDKKLPLPISQIEIQNLEEKIDIAQEKTPALITFILPGGGIVSAHLHLARSVCRRAERKIVVISKEEKLDELILCYVNRLSDYLFATARLYSQNETLWEKQK